MPWTNSATRYYQYLNRVYDKTIFVGHINEIKGWGHVSVGYACKLSRLMYDIEL